MNEKSKLLDKLDSKPSLALTQNSTAGGSTTCIITQKQRILDKLDRNSIESNTSIEGSAKDLPYIVHERPNGTIATSILKKTSSRTSSAN